MDNYNYSCTYTRYNYTYLSTYKYTNKYELYQI